MRHAIATFLLGPVLLVQGRWVRNRIPLLREPRGARSGMTGRGPTVRLLIAGDSAAAGVGAESQREALAGQLAALLSESFSVEWRLEARTGATTSDTIDRLSRLTDSTFDVLVTSLGVNDVTRGVSTNSWLASQRKLRQVARQRLGVSLMVLAGLPPVDGFPALPQPLRWYLGSRAKDLSGLLEQDVEEESSVVFVDLRFTNDASLMAADGFHPGPAIYREWAMRVADVIRRRWPPSSGDARQGD